MCIKEITGSYTVCMKKEEWIAYLIIWTVLLGTSAYFIYSVGFQKLIFAKVEEGSVEIEDQFLQEQLILENEERVQKKDAEAVREEQAKAELEAQEQLSKETQAVFSNAVARIQESGNFLSSCFIVDPDTTLLEADVPLQTLINNDMSMDADASEPQILIYHTHASEGYVDSVDGDASTTVVGVGDYLQELLTTRYGYHVLHVTEAYDLAEGTLNRSRAYNYARDGLETILAEHSNIQVIIDLHRDGVDEDQHLVTEIDGKQTAKIMFFNGLSRTNEQGELTSLPNSYTQDNLAFSLQLELLGDYYYPGYVRGVYVKGYRYNLHFRPKSLLLEVGAQTNTLEEAKNAMEPFAEILSKLLKGT